MFILLMTYLFAFAELAFPLIPEQFGGGRPRQAHLLFRNEGIDDAQLLGLGVTQLNPLSADVSILWESEEALVINPPGPINEDSVMRLDKALISVVVLGTFTPSDSSTPSATPLPDAPH